MKQTLNIKMGQTLAMTPQLQQAIKLLQLSTLELQTEIQSALENNPMLEMQEEEAGESRKTEISSDQSVESKDQVRLDEREQARAEAGKETEVSDIDVEQASMEMSAEATEVMPEELPVDSAWEDIYETATATSAYSGGESDNRDFTEFHNSAISSIQDHLMEQIRLSPLSERDQFIAETLIDAIDDRGYLTEEMDTLLGGLNRDIDEEHADSRVEDDEVEAVLKMIQHLEPPGCGARNASECMQIQLSQLPSSEVNENAKRLVANHLDLLALHDFPKLRRLLKVNDDHLREVIALIRALNPRPGRQLVQDHDQYIIPDVFVQKVKGVWRVELNPDIAPKLGINALYAKEVKRADKSDDNTFLRNHLQEARWFIKSLQSRNETLLKVATAIVERQRGFLEYGEEAMKPLVLRDIAEQLDLHESTISRVTTQKFIHTPRGIFEFKYFFSSHVSTANGGECSATAIRARIRKFIKAEDATKPLSDSKIASRLVAEGIQVARRTVAKYRESMSIPPSNERKRLH